MISETSTLMVTAKSCQVSLLAIVYGENDSAGLEEALLRGFSGLNQVAEPVQKASNEKMNYLREQIGRRWCLSVRLSGNGLKSLATPIPAPGGDQ